MKKGVSIIIKCVVVFIAISYLILLFVEFNRYEKDLPMLFPIKKTELHVYDDGEVEINTGLGYKTITYNRDSAIGKEFGHIFIQERNISNQ